MTDTDRLAALLHDDKYLGPAIHEDAYAAQHPTWPATECSACWSLAARLAAAGVTVAHQPAGLDVERLAAAIHDDRHDGPMCRTCRDEAGWLIYDILPIAQPAPDALRAAAQAVPEDLRLPLAAAISDIEANRPVRQGCRFRVIEFLRAALGDER